MHSFKTVFAAAALALLAQSQDTIKITAKSDKTFDPDTVKASKGDTLEFHFEPKNHSVVSGDYDYPCSPLQRGTGFFSGFISSDDGEADDVFRVVINSTDPMPFYSSQDRECSNGMVGIINPNDDMTLDDYKKRASGLSKAVTPGDSSYGGQVAANDGGDDSDDDDDDDDGGDSDDEDDDEDDSDASPNDDDEGAAVTTGAPMLGLLGAMGVAVFMS